MLTCKETSQPRRVKRFRVPGDRLCPIVAELVSTFIPSLLLQVPVIWSSVPLADDLVLRRAMKAGYEHEDYVSRKTDMRLVCHQ